MTAAASTTPSPGPSRPGPAARYRVGQDIRPEVVEITTLRCTLWTRLATIAGTVPAVVVARSVRHHRPGSRPGPFPVGVARFSLPDA